MISDPIEFELFKNSLFSIADEMALADAVEAAKRDTRRYTKRQFTWFRHQLPDWPWVAAAEAERMVNAALKPLIA